MSMWRYVAMRAIRDPSAYGTAVAVGASGLSFALEGGSQPSPFFAGVILGGLLVWFLGLMTAPFRDDGREP